MKSLCEKLSELRVKREKALMPYFTAGIPSPERTVELVLDAERAGADAVELGVPFSDPIADGPIIQRASLEALEAGVNSDVIFNRICAPLKEKAGIPYMLMTYYNPVYRYGIERFVMKCSKSGVSGLIVPDLPYEESHPIRHVCETHGISLISFITPFTPLARAEKIIGSARGFIYFVTAAGVTGPRSAFSVALKHKLKAIGKMADIPVMAGFGISSPEQVSTIKDDVDGIIVGSYFVKKVIDGKINELWTAIRKFKRALD